MPTDLTFSFIRKSFIGRPRRRRGIRGESPTERLESRVLLTTGPIITSAGGEPAESLLDPQYLPPVEETPTTDPTGSGYQDEPADPYLMDPPGPQPIGPTDPGPTGGDPTTPIAAPDPVDPAPDPNIADMEFGIHNPYTLAHMANAAYTGADGKTNPDGTPVVKLDDVTAALPKKLRDAGWKAEAIVSDENSGFHAVHFKNTKSGEHVLAFAGTAILSGKDWLTNSAQAMGLKAEQYESAMKMAQKPKDDHDGAGIRFTGHSLGGGLASAAALATGIEAVTFNAAGIHKNTKTPDGNKLDLTMADSLITAYRVCGKITGVYLDPLSLLQAGTSPKGLVGSIPDVFKLFTG